jgi:3-hydroxyacyl-CoA dehydrogenase
MFMADRIGLREVCAAVERLHQGLHPGHGAWWEPAPLLRRLAREGRSFAQWAQERRS